MILTIVGKIFVHSFVYVERAKISFVFVCLCSIVFVTTERRLLCYYNSTTTTITLTTVVIYCCYNRHMQVICFSYRQSFVYYLSSSNNCLRSCGSRNRVLASRVYCSAAIMSSRLHSARGSSGTASSAPLVHGGGGAATAVAVNAAAAVKGVGGGIGAATTTAGGPRPPSVTSGVHDQRAKTILKEAVDAVVNSFAKHTQGYGRGKARTVGEEMLSYMTSLALQTKKTLLAIRSFFTYPVLFFSLSFCLSQTPAKYFPILLKQLSYIVLVSFYKDLLG